MRATISYIASFVCILVDRLSRSLAVGPSQQSMPAITNVPGVAVESSAVVETVATAVSKTAAPATSLFIFTYDHNAFVPTRFR